MNELQHIQGQIEKTILACDDLCSAVVCYKHNKKNDKRTTQTLMYELSQINPFFVKLDLAKFQQAINTMELR